MDGSLNDCFFGVFADTSRWFYTGFSPSSRNGGQNSLRRTEDCRTVVQKTGELMCVWPKMVQYGRGALGVSSRGGVVFLRNIEVMKQRLKDLWKEGSRICSLPGPTGEQAKVLNVLTLSLQ